MTLASPHPLRSLVLLCALGSAAGAAQSTKLSQPLNDTGAKLCLVSNQFTKECAGTGQDGEFGRDVTKKNDKDGKSGFGFEKICNSGELAGSGACPAEPILGPGANEWACNRDKVTKLIWEVKTKGGGLRDWLKIYTNWGDGRSGDTSEFVAQVNAQGLCGANDWRLPKVQELHGLVSYGVPSPGPSIAKGMFPNTPGGKTVPSFGLYWTADGYAGYTLFDWVVDFNDGSVFAAGGDDFFGGYAARLVRTGQ
ncbi:DUF1566 domain-containing protein [Ideonella sp.]|uniref:Lcl C-terminal domain-containing protein n=1 Tax=Ideonella sp. TaxID=1929293 RepID=UPI003BB729EC